MAGKPKLGLEFFSVDVDMTRNMKVRRLMREYGTEGYTILMFLLSWIYEKGQFWRYDNLEDVLFGLSEATNIDEERIKKIINFLLELRLFDKHSFKQGYLTSHEIQRRYYYATKRRKVRILEECCLLSKEDMNLIDSKVDYNDSIIADKDGIHVYKDEMSADKHKQSNSNSNSKRKKDKGMINNDIGSVDPATIPFKLNYYLLVLIQNHIVKGTEEWITVLNDFLYTVTKRNNKDDVRKAIYYTIKRINHNQWKDEHGYEITNKEPYLEVTINNNIDYNESEPERIMRVKSIDKIFHGIKKSST
jgi:hypothetical protein